MGQSKAWISKLLNRMEMEIFSLGTEDSNHPPLKNRNSPHSLSLLSSLNKLRKSNPEFPEFPASLKGGWEQELIHVPHMARTGFVDKTLWNFGWNCGVCSLEVGVSTRNSSSRHSQSLQDSLEQQSCRTLLPSSKTGCRPPAFTPGNKFHPHCNFKVQLDLQVCSGIKKDSQLVTKRQVRYKLGNRESLDPCPYGFVVWL